jgi:hypothetical protein
MTMRAAIAVSILLTLAVGDATFAVVPRTVSYQGVVMQADGRIPLDGDYDLGFRLYYVPDGGDPLWEETQTLTVTDGIFSALLGSVVPLDLPFDRTYWLGVSVGGEAELTPRVELASAPYALRAAVADSVLGGGSAGIGGGGTAGRVPKFTASDEIGNSMIRESGGGIGIGTAAPEAKLDVRTSGGDEETATAGNFSSSVGSNGVARGVVIEATKLTEGSATAVDARATSGGIGYGDVTAVYGGSSNDVGEYGTAYGLHGAASVGDYGYAYGVFGQATAGRGGTAWGGYFNGDVYASGRLGVGTTVPEQKLDLRGNACVTGNVGIGTIEPLSELDVRDDELAGNLSGAVGYFGTETAGRIALVGDATPGMSAVFPSDLGIGVYGNGGDFGGYFAGKGYFSDTLGVGTSQPSEKLDVSGTVKMTGFAMPTGASDGYVLTSDGAGGGTWEAPAGVPDNDWTIYGHDMYSSVDGNVGIGTPIPSEKLDVVGTVEMSGFKMATGGAEDYVLTSDASGVGTWKPPLAGGDITAVYGDDGLLGECTSGDAHLSVGVGDGIQVLADAVAVRTQAFAGDGLIETSNDLHVNTATGLEIWGDAVQLSAAYSSGAAYDGVFVNEGQTNSVSQAMIASSAVGSDELQSGIALDASSIAVTGTSSEALVVTTSGHPDSGAAVLLEHLNGGTALRARTIGGSDPAIWVDNTGTGSGVFVHVSGGGSVSTGVSAANVGGGFAFEGFVAGGTAGDGAAVRAWHFNDGVAVRGATTGDSWPGVLGSSTGTSGTGAAGVGSNMGTCVTLDVGSGLAGTGERVGVFGTVIGEQGERAGAYFSSDGGNHAYVAKRELGYPDYVYYKIKGTGTCASVMQTGRGRVTLIAPESPEAWVQDFGSGEMVGGVASVDLDPTFLECVTISEEIPMRVLITFTSPPPDGHYVAKRSDGFDVLATSGDATDATFDYFVSARWRGWERIRFAPDSGPLEQRTEELRQDARAN